MSTTTKLGDYLGRALHNDNPGTSVAKDYLNRDITSGNKDFNGVGLVDTPNFPPADWTNGHAYTAGTRAKIPPTNEVQTLTVTATANNYKLAVTLAGDTQTTANILYSASAATITAAIVALPNVEPGDIVVSGGSSPYTITIQGELGNVAQIAVAAGSPDITGGTVVVGTSTQGAALGAILEVTVGGTSDATKPTAPAVGATVTDNTVTWVRLK